MIVVNFGFLFVVVASVAIIFVGLLGVKKIMDPLSGSIVKYVPLVVL